MQRDFHIRGYGDPDAEREYVGLPILGDLVLVTLRLKRTWPWERKTPALVVMFMFGCALSGCTSGNPTDPRVSAPGVPSGKQSSEPLASLLKLVDQNMAERPKGTIISVAARPTVVTQGAQRQTMIIRDEDQAKWATGRYRLTVRCAGKGDLVAHFSIDDRAVVKQLSPCAPTMSIDYVDLSVIQSGKVSTIVIVPVGETVAAVGYDITKSE